VRVFTLPREAPFPGQSLNIGIFADVSLHVACRWSRISHCLKPDVSETAKPHNLRYNCKQRYRIAIGDNLATLVSVFFALVQFSYMGTGRLQQSVGRWQKNIHQCHESGKLAQWYCAPVTSERSRLQTHVMPMLPEEAGLLICDTMLFGGESSTFRRFLLLLSSRSAFLVLLGSEHSHYKPKKRRELVAKGHGVTSRANISAILLWESQTSEFTTSYKKNRLSQSLTKCHDTKLFMALKSSRRLCLESRYCSRYSD
jgi:hypothetical protein